MPDNVKPRVDPSLSDSLHDYLPPRSASELIDRYTKGERHFVGAQLEQAKLSNARLWGVDLSRANLQGADLSGALLEDSDFSGADLTGAILTDARCHGAKFNGAILSQARLPERKGNWPDENIWREASDIYRGRNEYVFVSYARVDQVLVRPLVDLIRSLGSRVFMDISSIVPGDKWRPVLTQALADAGVVIVFWCQHSALSHEVKNEYTSAHTQGKAIIPVLLDATPVSPPLNDYQWLDFNGTFASHDPSKTRGRIEGDKLRARQQRPGTGPVLRKSVSFVNYEEQDIKKAKEALLQTIAARVESRSSSGSL